MNVRRSSKGKKADLSSEELKERIIAHARQHFARDGFQGTSLKEIAKDANVAGSLINYHFKDKEGLFKVCVESFARGRMEAILRLLGQVNTREEFRIRIEMFAQEMISALVADQSGFEIVDGAMRSMNPIVLKIFEETMLKAFLGVVEFMRQAQERKILDPSMDPVMLSSVLFTSTCDVVRKQQVAKRFFNIDCADPEWQRTFARHISLLFSKGATP